MEDKIDNSLAHVIPEEQRPHVLCAHLWIEWFSCLSLLAGDKPNQEPVRRIGTLSCVIGQDTELSL